VIFKLLVVMFEERGIFSRGLRGFCLGLEWYRFFKRGWGVNSRNEL